MLLPDIDYTSWNIRHGKHESYQVSPLDVDTHKSINSNFTFPALQKCKKNTPSKSKTEKRAVIHQCFAITEWEKMDGLRIHFMIGISGRNL